MAQILVEPLNDAHFRDTMSSVARLTAGCSDGKKHLLLAASGSVATIKVPVIIQALANFRNLSIRVVLTNSAKNFLAGQVAEQPTVASLLNLPNVDAVYEDEDEWDPPWSRGTAVFHIELRRWADLLVVAPLSANTLAKIVNGFSDNLLTSCVRAWDITAGKRIIVAPAMNTAMWLHPITAKQMRVLEEDWGVKAEVEAEEASESEGTGALKNSIKGWFEVIQPIVKTLACNDIGPGAMASVETIVQVIEKRMGLEKR